jgi:hypothetical protein
LPQVHEINQKYNIELDNLCQFLPQDMVSEFAKCDPKRMLELTQRALGNAEMLSVCAAMVVWIEVGANEICFRSFREQTVRDGDTFGRRKRPISKFLAIFHTQNVFRHRKEWKEILGAPNSIKRLYCSCHQLAFFFAFTVHAQAHKEIISLPCDSEPPFGAQFPSVKPDIRFVIADSGASIPSNQYLFHFRLTKSRPRSS